MKSNRIITWIISAIGFIIIALVWQEMKPGKSKRKSFDFQQSNAKVDLILQYKMKDITAGKECTINTTQNEKAKGIKVIVHYPCWWQEKTESYESNPTLIKHYLGQLYNTFVSVGLDISTLSNSFTTEKLTEDFFSERLRPQEDFISYRQLLFGSVLGVEVITSMPVSNGWYLYYITYEIIYKKKLVSITYSVGADNKLDAQQVFEARKNIILELAERTEFLN